MNIRFCTFLKKKKKIKFIIKIIVNNGIFNINQLWYYSNILIIFINLYYK